MKRGVVTLGTFLLLTPVGCTDDTTSESGGTETGTETGGDGDGDPTTGDGDGDPTTGDGDGDPTTGDGDGDPATGDGDGDPMTGDGDGDPMTGDGDGDGDTGGDVCGDGMVTGDEVCDDGVNDGSYGSCTEDCLGFGPNCGDGEIDMDNEVCDDGVNDGSYGGCSEDCQALGPNCGDGEIDMDNEVCDDGVNDGSYGGCAEGCQALGPFCGDGLVDGDNETCDDENADLDDGCDDVCQVEDLNCCDGEPSVCAPIGMIGGLSEMLALDIPDDAYDGTLDSMACVEVEVNLPDGICAPVVTGGVEVDLGIDHTWVGDLVVKLEDPDGVVTTLMSRVGFDEGADDGGGCCGDSSNLGGDAVITFLEGGQTDPEDMGNSIGSNELVCADDDLCEYDPNPGVVMDNPFEDHIGGTANGTWRLCAGDSVGGDTGAIQSVGVRLTGEAPPPDP